MSERGLREQKKQRVRETILEVCGRLFRARGFDETTIDEIAQDAGISRQTFFNYFASKDAVLAELGLEWLRSQAERPRRGRRRPPVGSILAGTREAVLAQLRAIERDRDFMRLVFTRSSLLFPQGPEVGGPADQKRLDRTRDVLRAIAALMGDAQQAGEIRDDLPPEQVAELYVSVMLFTIRLWLIDYWSDGARLVERGESALRVLEDGLTRKTPR